MPDEQLEQLAALINELYVTISGPAGTRDWSREREIFHPEAQLMRTGVDEGGRPWIRVMSVDDYIEDTTPWRALARRQRAVGQRESRSRSARRMALIVAREAVTVGPRLTPLRATKTVAALSPSFRPPGLPKTCARV